jgi:hypothetical protein
MSRFPPVDTKNKHCLVVLLAAFVKKNPNSIVKLRLFTLIAGADKP